MGATGRGFVVAFAFVAAAALATGDGSAQTVSMSGSLGKNALLVIDGKPRNVAVGATVEGVRLVSVSGNDAVVEVGGRRITLLLGGAQVNLGGKASEGTGARIVLTTSTGGHYVTAGSINGKSVRFVVDTGATSVSLSRDEAEHIGLDYKSGQRGYVGTANGAAPAYKLMLNSIRIGDVELHNIEATVIPAPMPYVLLGNSFLSHFQMRQDGDRMTLDKRY